VCNIRRFATESTLIRTFDKRFCSPASKTCSAAYLFIALVTGLIYGYAQRCPLAVLSRESNANRPKPPTGLFRSRLLAQLVAAPVGLPAMSHLIRVRHRTTFISCLFKKHYDSIGPGSPAPTCDILRHLATFLSRINRESSSSLPFLGEVARYFETGSSASPAMPILVPRRTL